jgi:hypothetical protein
VAIRRPDRERDKWHALHSSSDLVDHIRILHQKLSALHHLLLVEPDVEVAADAIDVRF